MSFAVEIPVSGKRASVTSASGFQASLGEAGDFVVLSESPISQILAGGDVMDGLAVGMASLPGLNDGAGQDQCPVQSLSLNTDIERLTAENAQLKKTALDNSTSLKKHVELCTVWREQMNKCHERDATMIEEARQTTLKLQEEVSTLHLCLQTAQKKLEDALVDRFRLEKEKKDLRLEVEKLTENLARCKEELAECVARAEEASFIHIEALEKPSSVNCQSAEKAGILVSSNKQAEEIEALHNEIHRLKADLEASRAVDTNSTVTDLQQENDDLKFKLTEAQDERSSMVTALQQENDDLKIKLAKAQDEERRATSKLTDLDLLVSQKQKDIERITADHDDLLRQISLDKVNFNEQREKHIETLQLRLQLAEKEIEACRKKEKEFQDVSKDFQFTTHCLNKTKNEVTLLSEQVRQLLAEKQRLEVIRGNADALTREVATLKERESTFDLLWNDQVSQIEALREALRGEQVSRQKLESDYANLLETWQAFEQTQRSEGPGSSESSQVSQINQAVLDFTNADRLRLEEEIRTLRDTIKDLQSQNLKLIQDKKVDVVQRAGAANTMESVARDSDSTRRCPLCRKEFTCLNTLMQHAAICDNENGVL